jgi:predicted aldo/keto reductase-like oxidoreductase
VCRLGLATRGESKLNPEDIQYALDRGINFVNWCGQVDALSQAIGELGKRRDEIAVCVQFEARTALAARVELTHTLRVLRTDYVDVLTFYYVEEPAEWGHISSAGGALEYCRKAQVDGLVRLLGLTTHQRLLAAIAARSGLLDLLMIRYNAAHRGAETDVFPLTDALKLPVVVYTCLRWGELLKSTPADPRGYSVPKAPAWYRFALQSPSVTVALMAPHDRRELEEDMTVLEVGQPLSVREHQELAEHGQRVRRYAGQFP